MVVVGLVAQGPVLVAQGPGLVAQGPVVAVVMAVAMAVAMTAAALEVAAPSSVRATGLGSWAPVVEPPSRHLEVNIAPTPPPNISRTQRPERLIRQVE